MEYMPKRNMLILPTSNILIINGVKHGCAGYDNARNASLEPYLYTPKKKLGKNIMEIRISYHNGENIGSSKA